MVPSAYVHIPFCDSICAYCDFVRIQKNEQFFSSWKEKLIQEIQEYKISNLHTLYFVLTVLIPLKVNDLGIGISNTIIVIIIAITPSLNASSLFFEISILNLLFVKYFKFIILW